MSITVANLMAQVGADLTQFRLGMNEVDARINQVKTRSAAGIAAVNNMRNEAMRLTTMANADATKRAVAMAAASSGKQMLPMLKKQVADAQAEVVKAETALSAIGSKRTATNAKSLAAAEKEVALRRASAAEAKRDYADTERQVKSLTSSVERLGLAEERNRRRANGMIAGANYREDLNSASTSVATAYANRLKQNSNEHRIRALNTISGTAENIGLGGIAGLGVASEVGAGFNQMLVQMAHNTQLSTSGIKTMDNTIRQLGETNGGDMHDIADSFRLLTDYGNDATNSQQMLQVAMKASVATGADLSAVTELLAASTKEFSIPVGRAATTMNIMVEASRRSSLTMQKMVEVAGPLYATAANLGVSFLDVNAALVTFTQHGLNAAQAAVQLRNDISKITQPTKTVQDTLKGFDKKYGTHLLPDFSQEGLRARSLLGVWNDIVKAADKARVRPADLAQKLFPNQRGTIGAVIATGTGFQDLARNRAVLAGYANGQQSNALNSAYQESLNQLNVQLDKVKNSAIVLAGDISSVLTPTIVNLVNKVQTGIQAFNNLDVATQASWTKMAVGASIGLIVFGVLGKLTVGVSALNTALIEMRGVGLAATIAELGPYALAIAAVGLVVGGLYLGIKKLTQAQVASNVELSAAADKTIAVSVATHAHDEVVLKLINQYKKLQNVHNQTNKQFNDMNAILNKISQLAPDLISGYDAQGTALNLVADAAERTTKNLHDMARAGVIAAASKIDMGLADTVDTRAQRADDIKRAQYSLKTGMFPDRNPDGSFKFNYPTKDQIIKSTNPYMSVDQSQWSVATTVSEGWKVPSMHQGTPAEKAAAAAVVRNGPSTLKSLSDLILSKNTDAIKVLKGGLAPFVPTAVKSIGDPYGANHVPSVPGLDPLAGIGGKDKKDKSADKWKERVHEATQYMEELRKKQYEVNNVGEIAANNWEIQSGKLKGMGKHYADVSRQIAAHTLQLELDKNMQDAVNASALVGHDDIKAAISLAGGIEKWKEMTAPQKAAVAHIASSTSVSNSLYDMGLSYQKRAQESVHPIKTATDEASASIDEYITKMHAAKGDPAFRKKVLNIMTWAQTIDDADTNKYTKAQKLGLFNEHENILSQNAGDIGKKNDAYQRWLADNKDRLDTMSPSRRTSFTNAMHISMDSNYDLRQQVEAQKTIDGLVESTLKKSIELKTLDPFDTWVNTLKTFDKDKGMFTLPELQNGKPMDISTQHRMYNLENQNTFDDRVKNQMHSLSEEAASMKESDPFRVWAQSYQIFDQRMNGGRGGFQALTAANEKSLKDLYDYQTKIDLMKKASEGLTGVIVGAINESYGKGFAGMFERIKQGFNRMLFDMATQILQSKLMQLLQSKVFGATGMGGANAGGGLAGIAGGIFGIASLFAGNSAHSAAVGASSFANNALATATSMAGRAIGGPISAGSSYIVGEHGPEVITPRAAGWVYPNSQSRNTSGDSGVHNYNIVINTPDAGSFHRSAGAVLDDMHKSAMRAHMRSR